MVFNVFCCYYYVEFNEEFPNFYSEYGRIKFVHLTLTKTYICFSFILKKVERWNENL